MPNYKYKCISCAHTETMFLKMSTDPKKRFDCKECDGEQSMTRRISKPAGHKGFKVWAGDWYKKTYGRDLGEGAHERASRIAEHRREVKRLRKDHGINLKEKAEDKNKED